MFYLLQYVGDCCKVVSTNVEKRKQVVLKKTLAFFRCHWRGSRKCSEDWIYSGVDVRRCPFHPESWLHNQVGSHPSFLCVPFFQRSFPHFWWSLPLPVVSNRTVLFSLAVGYGPISYLGSGLLLFLHL